MAETTLISWTHHTFNPAMGCARVSEGCRNCYAADLVEGRMGLKVWGPSAGRQITSKSTWANPPRWDREAARSGERHRVFCASLCDVFEDHPTINGMRPRLWELIRSCPNLDWQLLTKRPQRIAQCLPADWGPHGWPNVWLGTSVESEEHVGRADHLRAVPGVVRFISYEPALGPIAHALDLTGLDWVIYGGESGPRFRKEDKQWARDMRDACDAAGVAFYHKQSSHRFTARGVELDGQVIHDYPTPRRTSLPVVGQSQLF